MLQALRILSRSSRSPEYSRRSSFWKVGSFRTSSLQVKALGSMLFSVMGRTTLLSSEKSTNALAETVVIFRSRITRAHLSFRLAQGAGCSSSNFGISPVPRMISVLAHSLK